MGSQRVKTISLYLERSVKIGEKYDGYKMTVFWDVTPCSLVEIDRIFRGAYCLHHTRTSQKTVIFILVPVRT
jgi:hypothetical protein